MRFPLRVQYGEVSPNQASERNPAMRSRTKCQRNSERVGSLPRNGHHLVLEAVQLSWLVQDENNTVTARPRDPNRPISG